MSDTEAVQYGPATITCPYCSETFKVEAGPTELCEVIHCEDGEWIIVNLETGKSGVASGDSSA